jgi:thioredoxin 1
LEEVDVAPSPSIFSRPQQQTTGTVTELSIDTFGAFIEDSTAAGVPVIVDFFTTWCGPCKFVAPEVEKMASEMPGVRFAKFDCGANDKKFVKELGIKALPTFHLYVNGVKRDQFVGAKARELRRFIDRHLAAPEGL